MTSILYRAVIDPAPLPRLRLAAHAPLLIAMALRLGTEGTATLSYLLIAAYALVGPAHAIRALALSWFFTLLNPGIAPDPASASVMRYVALGGAAASVAIHGFGRSRHVHPFTLATMLLGLFIVVHSLLFSLMPAVSVLKALSWTIVTTTLLSAWLGLSQQQRQALAGELFWSLAGILLISVPFVFLPAGYLRNGTGFQGILNHPQAFGPTIALLGAWVATRLFAEPRPAWRLVALAGACLALVLMSESRTAGLAMLLGTGLAFAIAPALSGRSARSLLPGLRSTRVWSVLGAVAIGGVAFLPSISHELAHYITKSGRAEVGGLAEAYDASRGRLMDAMLVNIAKTPTSGIGFGIASDPHTMVVQRDPHFGLPVSASIEKGVMPLAIVEELGIAGAAIVAFWVYCLLRRAARSGVAPLAVCLTVLMLNMGESTFFSPGGLGLITLVLIAWAYAGGTRNMVPRG